MWDLQAQSAVLPWTILSIDLSNTFFEALSDVVSHLVLLLGLCKQKVSQQATIQIDHSHGRWPSESLPSTSVSSTAMSPHLPSLHYCLNSHLWCQVQYLHPPPASQGLWPSHWNPHAVNSQQQASQVHWRSPSSWSQAIAMKTCESQFESLQMTTQCPLEFSWQLSSQLLCLHHQVLISLLEEGVGLSQMGSVAILSPMHLSTFHQHCMFFHQVSPHLSGPVVCQLEWSVLIILPVSMCSFPQASPTWDWLVDLFIDFNIIELEGLAYHRY